VIDEEPAAPSEYVIDEEPAAPKEYVIDEEPAAPKEYVIDDVPAAPSPDADTGYEDMITGPRPSQPSESDAVDLYELGAVDYEPENVHHNA
jgi:hypothetical protein